MVGFMVFAGFLLYILYPVLAGRMRSRWPRDRILLLLMTAFVVFGLVHDIFYQRVFWMLLGALCACPAGVPPRAASWLPRGRNPMTFAARTNARPGQPGSD